MTEKKVKRRKREKFQITEKDSIILKNLEKIGLREGLLRMFKELKVEGKVPFSYGDIAYRFKSLVTRNLLRSRIILNYPRLKLQSVIITFGIKPENTALFEKVLTVNPTLIYYARRYGSETGYFAEFAIPIANYSEFLEFVNLIKNEKIAEDYKLYLTEKHVYTGVGFDWFDFKTQKIMYRWDDFINEVKSKVITKEIEEREERVEFLDEMDAEILKFLEENPLIKLTKIAQKLKTTTALVKYHFDNHITRNRYIDRYAMFIWLFGPHEFVQTNLSIVSFKSKKWRDSFIDSLYGKPFVYSLVTFIKSNDLCLITLLPSKEVLEFNRVLWKLTEEGIINNYIFDALDPQYSKKTVHPYHLLKEKEERWEYPHEQIISKAKEIITSRKT